jgi:hypothetical protein
LLRVRSLTNCSMAYITDHSIRSQVWLLDG